MADTQGRIFISHSGEASHSVARALQEWLPTFFPNAHIFVSSTSIPTGADWWAEIGDELVAADFGILCLTRENVDSRWILYEAGMLCYRGKAARVCPYVIDMEIEDLDTPLKMRQARRADNGGTLDLVKNINATIKAGLPVSVLEDSFSARWPKLKRVIAEAIASVPVKAKDEAQSKFDIETGIEQMQRSLAWLVERVSMQSADTKAALADLERGMDQLTGFRFKPGKSTLAEFAESLDQVALTKDEGIMPGGAVISDGSGNQYVFPTTRYTISPAAPRSPKNEPPEQGEGDDQESAKVDPGEEAKPSS